MPPKAGDNLAQFGLPLLPQAFYFADLWVRSARLTAAFGSVGAQVTCPTHLKQVTLGRHSLAPGEPRIGEAFIENPAADCVLRLNAADLHKRLVAQTEFPVAERELQFSLPMPPALTVVGWLDTQLVHGEDTLNVRPLDDSVNNLHPNPRKMQSVMWIDYPQDFIRPMIAEKSTRNGVDAKYGSPGGGSSKGPTAFGPGGGVGPAGQ